MTVFDTALARFGGGGDLPGPLAAIVRRTAGLSQILTTRTTVTALLDLPDVQVPYGERSALLGLDAFPLALDGAPHEAARDLVQRVLGGSKAAQRKGVAVAERLAGARVRAAGDSLDVVRSLVDPALEAWVEQWFGLESWGPRLTRCGRLALHAIFLNPRQPRGQVDFPALRFAVDTVQGTRADLAAHLQGTSGVQAGTVGAELLDETRDADLTARHLLGLTVGPLALGTWALTQVIDDLLDRPWAAERLWIEPAEGADATARADARRASAARGRVEFAATVRRRPPLPGVLRHNPRARSAPVEVPDGEILAATACAMQLDDGQPGEDLSFGHGRHRCLGPDQIAEVAGVVLAALGGRSPRRQQGRSGRLGCGDGPSAVQVWPFPSRLLVDLGG